MLNRALVHMGEDTNNGQLRDISPSGSLTVPHGRFRKLCPISFFSLTIDRRIVHLAYPSQDAWHIYVLSIPHTAYYVLSHTIRPLRSLFLHIITSNQDQFFPQFGEGRMPKSQLMPLANPRHQIIDIHCYSLLFVPQPRTHQTAAQDPSPM